MKASKIFILISIFSIFEIRADVVKSREIEVKIVESQAVITENPSYQTNLEIMKYGFIKYLPLKLQVAENEVRNISYEFEFVARNGVPEVYTLTQEGDFNSLMVGGEGKVQLTPGVHNYSIQYKVNNALVESEVAGAFEWYLLNGERIMETEKMSVRALFPVGIDPAQAKAFIRVIEMEDKETVDGVFKENMRLEGGRPVVNLIASRPIKKNEIAILTMIWKKNSAKAIPDNQTGASIKLDDTGKILRLPENIQEGRTVKVE